MDDAKMSVIGLALLLEARKASERRENLISSSIISSNLIWPFPHTAKNFPRDKQKNIELKLASHLAESFRVDDACKFMSFVLASVASRRTTNGFILCNFFRMLDLRLEKSETWNHDAVVLWRQSRVELPINAIQVCICLHQPTPHFPFIPFISLEIRVAKLSRKYSSRSHLVRRAAFIRKWQESYKNRWKYGKKSGNELVKGSRSMHSAPLVIINFHFHEFSPLLRIA